MVVGLATHTFTQAEILYPSFSLPAFLAVHFLEQVLGSFCTSVFPATEGDSQEIRCAIIEEEVSVWFCVLVKEMQSSLGVCVESFPLCGKHPG